MFYSTDKYYRIIVIVAINLLSNCVCLYAGEMPLHSFDAQLILTGKVKRLSNVNKKNLAARYRLIGIPYDSKSEELFAQVRSVVIRNYNGDIIDWVAYSPLMHANRCFMGEKFYLANATFPRYVPYAWVLDDQGNAKGEVVVVSHEPEVSKVSFTIFAKPAVVRQKSSF